MYWGHGMSTFYAVLPLPCDDPLSSELCAAANVAPGFIRMAFLNSTQAETTEMQACPFDSLLVW
jgi:hypothetical protein